MPRCRRPPAIGACLEVDGGELVLLARTRRGYSNLSRLISLAHETTTDANRMTEHRSRTIA